MPDPTPVAGTENGSSALVCCVVIVTTAGLTAWAAATMADCSLIVATCWGELEAVAPTTAAGAGTGRLSAPDMSRAVYVPAEASVAAISAATTTNASPVDRAGAGWGVAWAWYGSIHWLGVAAAFQASWDHVGRGSGGGL